ncbi:MAG TPA: hypothetical protein VK395_20580 [Gemmataceae bacterium]|nr:hypothetical protein [Gemmataceae bacterium]
MRTLGLAVSRAYLLFAFAGALTVPFMFTRDGAAQTAIPATRAAIPVSIASSGVPTHELAKKIAVKGEDRANQLQTLCLSPDGNVVALVARPRYGAVSQAHATSEVQVFDPQGNSVRKWKVKFLAQSINAGPDGSILVAGDGRIARFDKEGQLLAEAEVPHLALLLKDSKKLRESAAEQLKVEIQSFEQTMKVFEGQKAELEKKDANQRTAQEKSQIKMFEMTLKQYEQMADQCRKRTVDQAVAQLTSRLKIINGVAATDHDVFVVCGEVKGYGYAIWRMAPDFTQPKAIVTGLGGCCGQMDIQAQGEEVLVAENTRHRVGRYNRDGKRLGSFGKHGRDGDAECFGGCCNPMNVRIVSGGTVYTAESEGFVKEFSPKGEFVKLVAHATVTGGCKNVAVAATPDGKTVYFCDQPGSQIIILTLKTTAKIGAE